MALKQNNVILEHHIRPDFVKLPDELFRFVPAIRLYEQGPGEPYYSFWLGEYIQRWARWAGGAVSGNIYRETHGLPANRQMLVTRHLEIVLSKNVANTPHVEVVVALIVEALVARAEVHVPRTTGDLGVGSRRPVVVRLHIHKRVARGQSWVKLMFINQTP